MNNMNVPKGALPLKEQNLWPLPQHGSPCGQLLTLDDGVVSAPVKEDAGRPARPTVDLVTLSYGNKTKGTTACVRDRSSIRREKWENRMFFFVFFWGGRGEGSNASGLWFYWRCAVATALLQSARIVLRDT